MKNPFSRKISKPEPVMYSTDYFSCAARHRALELLWSHLTDAQKREYVLSNCRWFTARGNVTGSEYTIRTGLVHRSNGSGQSWWCLEVSPHDPVPYEDILLAKKILIENDENLFIRTAICQ